METSLSGSNLYNESPTYGWGFHLSAMMYPLPMSRLEIVDSVLHPNKGGRPFVVALVDDPAHGDTKLVVMFEDDGYTAVLSVEKILDEEDISVRGNGWPSVLFDAELRDILWARDENLDGDDW